MMHGSEGMRLQHGHACMHGSSLKYVNDSMHPTSQQQSINHLAQEMQSDRCREACW